jgi:hypothetical protein
MTGFAPEWLRLREGADHRARNPRLLDGLAAHFAGRDPITIVDLGAGLGSNLRAIAPVLAGHQRWILVDNDPTLLAGACDAIAAWADSARASALGIEASKAGRSLRVELKRHDLAADPAAWAALDADLVTAAALFDLVSEEWIERLVAALSRARLPIYAALTHDGNTAWKPAHPADATMTAAFERHFARDKGFGPSAGGRAPELLAGRLLAAGYKVERAPSPWRLAAADAALVAALAEGWAEAVRETGNVSAATISDWFTARTGGGIACTVGHEDLFAIPPR